MAELRYSISCSCPHRKAPISGMWLAVAISFAVCLLFPSAQARSQARTPEDVNVQVLDDKAQPLSGVLIETEIGGTVVSTTTSDAHGRASVRCEAAQPCTMIVSMNGYNSVQMPVGSGKSADLTLQISLSKTMRHEETVTVQANAESPIATSESSESKLPVAEATASPLRPATLIDALPLVPGVIRTPDGRVKIAGLDEQHSALI